MTLKLLFAGDGPRDEAAMPPLVRQLLGGEFSAEFEAWKSLRVTGRAKGIGKGGQRLLYLIRQARDRGADGIVATVDCDKSQPGEKLRDLVAARQRDRMAGNATPAAVGEAIPHLEAWLIDDPVAVRSALGLPTSAEITSPSKTKYPKDDLQRLYDASDCQLEALKALAAIADALELRRCNHCDTTGLGAFARDVAAELSPLATGSAQ